MATCFVFAVTVNDLLSDWLVRISYSSACFVAILDYRGGIQRLEKKMALIYSFIVLLLASYINADKETLVLLDNLAIRETHSIFFKSLTGQFNSYK